MPRLLEGHRSTVVPDWVCEVLSPSTESKDREIKMPIYARFGVAHAWLVDPRKRTPWRPVTWSTAPGTKVAATVARTRSVPFGAVTLPLDDLWAQ